jgi:adenosylcobinamide-phosphate synthase
MATMAAALPARLVKPGAYDLDPNAVGANGVATDPDDASALPDAATATRAVEFTRRAGLLAAAAAGVIAWF